VVAAASNPRQATPRPACSRLSRLQVGTGTIAAHLHPGRWAKAEARLGMGVAAPWARAVHRSSASQWNGEPAHAGPTSIQTVVMLSPICRPRAQSCERGQRCAPGRATARCVGCTSRLNTLGGKARKSGAGGKSWPPRRSDCPRQQGHVTPGAASYLLQRGGQPPVALEYGERGNAELAPNSN
jgi:hypothetical protein